MTLILRRAGNLGGMLGPCVWAFAIVFIGSRNPGYSHVSQYISELGERGSPTEFLMQSVGFIVPGIMHLAFAAFLFASFRGTRGAGLGAALIALDSLGRVGAGLFPCDPGCAPALPSLSQAIHGWSARVGFLSMVGATITWGLIAGKYARLRGLRGYSMISGATGLTALLAVTLVARNRVGLYESIATGVLSLWLFVFAFRLWMLEGAPMGGGDQART